MHSRRVVPYSRETRSLTSACDKKLGGTPRFLKQSLAAFTPLLPFLKNPNPMSGEERLELESRQTGDTLRVVLDIAVFDV